MRQLQAENIVYENMEKTAAEEAKSKLAEQKGKETRALNGAISRLVAEVKFLKERLASQTT
jgi:hypothetical protein